MLYLCEESRKVTLPHFIIYKNGSYDVGQAHCLLSLIKPQRTDLAVWNSVPMERGGAKLKDFTLKQKIISFTKQCIFIEGWMEFECQVLSLTFSQGACSQDCIFLMKMVQAGSLISEMELLWYCFTLQKGCVVLKGLFFPQSAIFHGYYFLPVIFHFAISAVPAWLFLTCLHWGQVSDLWVDDSFFFLSLSAGDFEENRKKVSHHTDYYLLSRGLMLWPYVIQ